MTENIDTASVQSHLANAIDGLDHLSEQIEEGLTFIGERITGSGTFVQMHLELMTKLDEMTVAILRLNTSDIHVCNECQEMITS